MFYRCDCCDREAGIEIAIRPIIMKTDSTRHYKFCGACYTRIWGKAADVEAEIRREKCTKANMRN